MGIIGVPIYLVLIKWLFIPALEAEEKKKRLGGDFKAENISPHPAILHSLALVTHLCYRSVGAFLLFSALRSDLPPNSYVVNAVDH